MLMISIINFQTNEVTSFRGHGPCRRSGSNLVYVWGPRRPSGSTLVCIWGLRRLRPSKTAKSELVWFTEDLFFPLPLSLLSPSNQSLLLPHRVIRQCFIITCNVSEGGASRWRLLRGTGSQFTAQTSSIHQFCLRTIRVSMNRIIK